ncbi:MAG TPA: NlpC/P60 family protein [Sphingomicrobium sp.]|nr:NlpC/P60 family protein [Sphingomicrobium sp.]
MKIDYAERARALVGTRFRPQGRHAQGLDCVGVAVATYRVPAEKVRRDYRLRGDHEAEIRAALNEKFRRIPATQLRAGDLMLMRVSNDQLHLGIRTEAGFVHAHARLCRVVETPGMPEWPLVGAYRRRRA